uniref:Threonylcarbamoyl-AMP synthase n=1 Tax=Panagrolaimus sp. ES5 TaxID=591445 RepID=A0AC34G9K6_9BILA
MAPILQLRSENDIKYAIKKAAEVLRNGGIIALPTDTIYGVSTLVKNSEKIYKLKHRPHEKPLGLFVANLNQIENANLSGTPESPLCIQDFKNLWSSLDLIIDAGPIVQNQGNRNGSTIIDLSVNGKFTIVRDGCAKEQTIKTLKEFGLVENQE